LRKELDVALVGYGPVGQLLAILLGQRGWKVGVFEKQPTPYPLPRAVHFDHEVARILQAAGLGEALPRLSEPADVYEWKNARGETLLLIGSKEMGVCGWPEANMFAQPELERALDARARALSNVEINRGYEVVGIEASDGVVELAVVNASGERHDVRARYAVGCDGANSFVRQRLGVTFTDLGFFFDWLIVDLTPHEQRVWEPVNGQLCDPARPTTFVSGGPGRRRWEFMRLPGETIEELNNEATAWRLLEPWNLTPANASLERHAVYTFQARWANEWRKGPIFLAGDAAHQMPPFAGQGMCSGIRDAANLAWKLDLVLAGKAADAMLDTYASERIPQVRQVVDFSIALGKVICVADAEEARARDTAMIAAARERGLTPPMPTPAIGPGMLLEGDPLAGHLFVQGEAQAGEKTGRFDDVVGRGFGLVSTLGDPTTALGPELAAAFASIGGFVAHVAPEAPIRDSKRSYERWFAEHGIGVALVRPDFHVFGTARSLTDSGKLVAALWSALGTPGSAR
jgi:2-polyprenyl-6-methoxyphenol hydroxylase-like FAD-dependent oxidoreductase